MNHPPVQIYMADDDADDRFFMQEALRVANPMVTIVEAEDGCELLAKLGAWSHEPAAQPVHLILLDMNMPKVNGLEALKAIKANPSLRHIPTVMVSTSAEPDQVSAAYAGGINGYIQKATLNEQIGQIARAIGICFLNTAAA